MLSVLQRRVENEGRTAIRVVEWLLWTQGEQGKGKVQSQRPHPQKTEGGAPVLRLSLEALCERIESCPQHRATHLRMSCGTEGHHFHHPWRNLVEGSFTSA